MELKLENLKPLINVIQYRQIYLKISIHQLNEMQTKDLLKHESLFQKD